MSERFEVSPDEVLLEWRQREATTSPQMRRAKRVRDVAGGEYAVPLPSSATAEETASIANFVDLTITSNAQRLRSVSPNIECLSARPGVKTHDEHAREQRLVSMGWRRDNRLNRKQGRRAREFIAYGVAARVILPDRELLGPRWERRDPLACFPGYMADPDDVLPPDIICSYTRSWSWLLHRYPDEVKYLYTGDKKPDLNDLFDMVEYLDHEQHLLMIVGRPDTDRRRSRVTAPAMISGVYSGIGKVIVDAGSSATGHYGRHEAVLLRCARNLAGQPLGVVAGRTGLDAERRGAADGQVPLYFRMSRLTAVWDDAIDRGVYPEEWVANPNGEAKVITQADGRAGIVGEISNGTIITRDLNPGYQTPQAIAALERMVRIEGPLTADQTGESPTNVRTARRGAEIVSATLDFDLAESQDTFADADRAELECAAAVAKGYFGPRTISMYSPAKKGKSDLTYVPNDLFDKVRFVVTYPLAGADANDQYLRSLQKQGGKNMSRRTAMTMDPDIEDPEQELDTIVSEQLEEALLSGIQQQAASGQIPPSDVARIMDLVSGNKMSLAAAVERVQREAQERQAQQVPANDPAAQPGIAIEGAGAEASVAAAQPSLEELLTSVAAR